MTPIPATAPASPPRDTFDPAVWPFHRPGVNPIARATPPGLERHAADWLRTANHAAEQVLMRDLRAAPGFHRFEDDLIGVVYRRAGDRLDRRRAFTRIHFPYIDGATPR